MPGEQRDAFFVQKRCVGGGVVGQKGISIKIPAWEEAREATELKFKVYHAYYAFKKSLLLCILYTWQLSINETHMFISLFWIFHYFQPYKTLVS